MAKEYKYDIFFKIEERGPNGRYKVLVDGQGYVCGVFGTYRAAKEAMPRIRRNLVRHFRERDAAQAVASRQTNVVTGQVGNA